MKDKNRFQTRSIQAGNEPDKDTGSVIAPMHLTSTFQQESVGIHKGFDYSRAGNPNRQRLEENVASLEEGDFGISFSSGMAATTALFQTLSAGDHVIIGQNVYGGTYRMAVEVLSDHGFEFDFVDTRSIDQIKSAIKQNTKWVFAETPTNPLLELCDIKQVAQLCKDYNIMLAVDNTFMSPYGQSPLSLGADIVMHSATKFLGGHSDLISGILVTDNSKLADRLYFIQKSGGAVSSPFDCWLLLRSTKTLSLRVQQQSNNAMELAKRLQSNSSIKRIIYPGLENHPQHELAKNQQRNPEGEPIFGSMISITLGSIDKRDHFLSRIKLFTLAESLGGVESLVCAPYHMTHVSVPKNIKEKIGLTADLLRLSVGVEHVEDLYLDICNALND